MADGICVEYAIATLPYYLLYYNCLFKKIQTLVIGVNLNAPFVETINNNSSSCTHKTNERLELKGNLLQQISTLKQRINYF